MKTVRKKKGHNRGVREVVTREYTRIAWSRAGTGAGGMTGKRRISK
jgi:hypothetical protein